MQESHFACSEDFLTIRVLLYSALCYPLLSALVRIVDTNVLCVLAYESWPRQFYFLCAAVNWGVRSDSLKTAIVT